MAQTQINGATAIRSGTIPWAAMATGAIVPTASLVDGANFLKKDGSVTVTGNINFGGFEAQNATAPTAASSLATKAYVDQKAGGIGGIHEVTGALGTNVTLSSPGATIDGITPVSGTSVFLLFGQTTTSQSGPWVWNGASSAMTRPTWWASGAVISTGHYFLVGPGGTTNGDSKYWCTNTSAITVDTTAETFVQDSSGTTYSNGTGLGLSAGVFSVLYGSTSTTATVGNDSRVVNALQTTSLGSGVQTALAIAVGSAGGPVTFNGALGTPSSGTLTNATGLPIAGITGVGTGVAAALAANTNAGSGLLTLSSGLVAAAQFPALTGDVSNTAGSLSTTVNNTAGSGFMKYTNMVVGEVVSGTINSSNTTFTVAHTPSASNGGTSSLMLYQDGELMQSGAGNDYTLSAATITMLSAPATGSKLIANYLF